MITPSQTALGQYKSLMADALDSDAFLRSTGEAVAMYDAAWKNAHNAGHDIDGPMADFLLICRAHLDAMAMAGLRRQAMAAMVSMLISVDMAGADTASLGLSFLELHRRFLIACAEFCRSTAGDAFAAPHAKAILAMEAPLYLATYENNADAASTEPSYAGLAEAARRKIAAGDDAQGPRIVPDPAAPAEALIDIFSRLHALGLGD